MRLGWWTGLHATFEQYELNRSNDLVLSDKTRLVACREDPSLVFEYELKLGDPSDEHLTVREGGFAWERRRGDGSVERPADPTDSAFDHGLWGLLDPAALLDASEIVQQANARTYELRPYPTYAHNHSDGTPTTTHRPMPSWVTAAPALYVSEAAYYEATLDPQQRVFESLTAVLADRPRVAARSWRLSGIEYLET